MEYDIRKIIPEVDSEITITGDLTKVMTHEQFELLKKTRAISEFGYEDGLTHIKFEGILTLEDVEKKIKEICEEISK